MGLFNFSKTKQVTETNIQQNNMNVTGNGNISMQNVSNSNINISNSVTQLNIIQHLTKESFKEKVFDFDNDTEWKYRGALPCVIDFYADWCQPCKAIGQSLNSVANEYNGKVNVFKINIDEEPELASMFQIQSIPTVLFVPMNDSPEISIGNVSIVQIKNIIKNKFNL